MPLKLIFNNSMSKVYMRYLSIFFLIFIPVMSFAHATNFFSEMLGQIPSSSINCVLKAPDHDRQTCINWCTKQGYSSGYCRYRGHPQIGACECQ